MGSRRTARETALQVLFQLDMQGITAAEGLSAVWSHLLDEISGQEPTGDLFESPLDEEARDYARHLVEGTYHKRAEIDQIITTSSKNWRLERMAQVDRNILRLAVYEMYWVKDVPDKVAINEAIEVAKRFGTAESAAFVNGILDRCLQDKP